MCDRPCESGGSVSVFLDGGLGLLTPPQHSVVHAEDGSTAVLGVLESVQPLRKAGSVGMQRTGLMHVGWWEGVLSVLANIKADYLRRPPSERASTAGDLAEESPVVSRPEEIIGHRPEYENFIKRGAAA